MIRAVGQEIEKANEQLARVEQIKKFKLLSENRQSGGEELTPTMKLKRKPIAKKYADEIEALYAEQPRLYGPSVDLVRHRCTNSPLGVSSLAAAVAAAAPRSSL